MISLPDFKEKQILFIQAEWGQKCGIRFSNDNIVFYKDGKIENRASCHRVFAVFIVGDIFITSGIIKEAQRHGISLFFLKNNFDKYATIQAQAEGNYLLRMKQYALSEAEEMRMAKNIVSNKISNQIALLRQKDKSVSEIQNLLEKIPSAQDSKELLGIEGNATRIYFRNYFDDIDWCRRMPRVKPDIPNFLMDMGYTYLFNLANALLGLYGFDTYKGIYHKLFFQRRSLACDIIEPFRCIIDKQILKSYNLKQINEKDFRVIKNQYTLDFKKSQKYNRIFSESIMDYKEDLFLFIHGFYRSLMSNENAFPSFSITKDKQL